MVKGGSKSLSQLHPTLFGGLL
nr:unnamed protein product [Callosobruchus chinensis]